MDTVRVLQVLADTDASPTNLAGMELHAQLSGAGVEMRTLALGPGRLGELAASVPAIAPGRRSLAAHTQLRVEQRWADVVLLRGARAALVASFAGGAAVPVVALSDEPGDWAGGRRVPWRLRRIAGRAASVVVAAPEDAGPVAERLALAPHRVVVAPPFRPDADDALRCWLDVVHSALPSRP